MDSVDNLMANTRNNPIEELDMRFPIRCEQYELGRSRPRPASGAAASASSGATASSSTARTRARATGRTTRPRASSAAGTGSSPPAARTRRRPQEEALPAKVTGIPFAAGRIHRDPRAERGRLRRPARARPGAGARGRARRLHDARDRPRRLRRRLRGRATLEIDAEATERLRAERGAPRRRPSARRSTSAERAAAGDPRLVAAGNAEFGRA